MEPQATMEAVERLVTRLVPPAAPSSQVHKRLTTYSLRLLSSRLSFNGSQDEFGLTESIKKKLVSAWGTSSAIAFTELHQKLQKMTILTNRSAVMQVLFSLSEISNQKDIPFPIGNFNLISSAGEHQQQHHQQDRKYSTINNALVSSRYNNNNNNNNVSISASKSTMSKPQYAMKDNTSMEVPESVLVRDVLFCMQGIEGKFIKYDVDNDTFAVIPDVGVPSATRDLIRRFGEIGWLHSKIHHFLRIQDDSVGLVAQGFRSAVQVEMSEYYHLVAVLQSAQTQGSSSDITTQQQQQQNVTGLTLRRLLVWTYEPMLRLRTIALMIDAAAGLRGGSLISALGAFSRHGDPVVVSLVQRLIHPACSPILNQLRQWVSDGELNDPYAEFFIEANPSIEDRRWTEKYTVRDSMLPSFVPLALAQRVLLIGKSINFIRRCCLHTQYMNPNIDAVQSLESLDFGSATTGIEAVVQSSEKHTNKKLVEILFEEFKYQKHCAAVKRYLLLGQGDFVRLLMDMIGEELSGIASTTMGHNLSGILEAAMRASNASNEDADIRERVHVAMMQDGPGEKGWGLFALEYKVDMPINAIITTDVMRSYKRIFNLLWRLKRVEHALSSTWKRQMTLSHNAEAAQVIISKQLNHEFGGKDGIRQQMQHFVTTLQYYMMFEVLESTWNVFQEAMNQSQNLDELIAAQTNYINSILQKGFLDAASETLHQLLTQIFGTILEYCGAQDRLTQLVEDEGYVNATTSKEQDKANRKAKWNLGAANVQIPSHLKQPEKQSYSTEISRLDRLRGIYFEKFETLRRLLKDQTSQPTLRSLVFKLDFSEFYRSRELAVQSQNKFNSNQGHQNVNKQQ